jgi:hypothetical protein
LASCRKRAVCEAGRLWAPDGSLAALAYQVVTVSA